MPVLGTRGVSAAAREGDAALSGRSAPFSTVALGIDRCSHQSTLTATGVLRVGAGLPARLKQDTFAVYYSHTVPCLCVGGLACSPPASLSDSIKE